MRVSLRLRTKVSVRPEDAYAWWTDYHEDDHHALPLGRFQDATREILDRDADGRAVRIRDTWRVLGREIGYESHLAYDPPHAIIERSEGPLGPFWARYAFKPTWRRRRTRIEWTVRGRVTAPWAKPLAATPGLARAVAQADLRGHVKRMERDLSLS